MHIPIYVQHADEILDLGLDRIEIQTSEDGEEFYPLTADSSAPGVVESSESERFYIGETDLKLNISGVWYTVEFEDLPYFLAVDIADRINAQTDNITASTLTGHVVLTTDDAGAEHYIKIGDGTANAGLGFAKDHLARGKDAHIDITTDTHYFFTDTLGTKDTVYRCRYIHPSLNAHSDWMEQQADPDWMVNPDAVCLVYFQTTEFSATPLTDITIGVTYAGQQTHSQIIGQHREFKTDEFGYVSFYAFRGMVLDVTVESTGLIRRITVPDQSLVNFLDPGIGEDDVLSVQQFDLPDAIRRS